MKTATNRTRAATIVLAGAMAMVLAACNTVQGLGRDIESVGRTGEEAIN